MVIFWALAALDIFPDANNAFVSGKRVSDGDRPFISDSVRSGNVELMKQCWKISPDDRSNLKEIVSLFGTEKVLESLDIEAMRHHQIRVYPAGTLPAQLEQNS
jgi:hypothetical protein